MCLAGAVGVGAGDEVIVPALTWMATAMAACYVGAVPVFVDIEPDTLCLDPRKVKEAITKKTKAIIPVHIYGSMTDMEAIMDISDKHGIPVIEDCAHAHGGVWAGRGVGSIGHIGSFSFQQSKTLSSGEGGICITNDSKLAETLYLLKHIGYDPMSGQGKAASAPPEGLVCHNYRATEFQAIILLESLKYLQAQTELCDKNAKYLGDLIADIPGVKIQSRGRLADLQGYYTLALLISPEAVNNMALDDIIKSLEAEGLVCAGRTYGPVYKHLLWNIPSNMYRIDGNGCPVCEDICDNKAVCISHSWLLADDKETIEAMSRAIKKVVNPA